MISHQIKKILLVFGLFPEAIKVASVDRVLSGGDMLRFFTAWSIEIAMSIKKSFSLITSVKAGLP